MNELHSLKSLRSRGWDRNDHKNELEELLMKTHGSRPLILTRSRAMLAALALVLCGALAGAGSAAAVYEWKGMSIKSTELDDGSTHVEVEKDGKKIIDEIVAPDEEAMVTDSGEMIVVVPDDGSDEDDDDKDDGE